ncbi:MAG: hypothetical protein A2Y33_10680 [Spirochaetes bacterium GWF1_51_8]|nr:MAG: hypothetical protein A2Y33_10680 [Spirochaetes bacterium GWF1_51_8]
MPVIGEKELRARAEKYITELQSNSIGAVIIEDSFRDYMVKLSIGTMGEVKIYYKPSKNTFSADFSGIKSKDDLAGLEDIWHGHTGGHDGYRIYVDGSCRNGVTGFAYAVVKDNRVLHQACGALSRAETADSAQIAGELRAVKDAVDWCAGNGVDEAEVFYDYAGIEKWATGEWNANHTVSKSYIGFLKGKPIKIKWHKVAAHTGDRWNSLVDKLAGSACVPENPDLFTL